MCYDHGECSFTIVFWQNFSPYLIDKRKGYKFAIERNDYETNERNERNEDSLNEILNRSF